jgi:ABC-type nitrate/sulfonate/bicarbonate transport system substrate-binding protein
MPIPAKSPTATLRLAALCVVIWALGVPGGPGSPAWSAEVTKIRVNTFPNAKALPVYVGLAKGLFAKYGLAVELENTESSQSQRDGLTAGRFQIAHAALDNAVAMIEVAKRDVVIVSGGDSGMNEFFVQPDIATFADLKGKTIVVDAPDTAYALQAKKLLLQHGLREGSDYTVKSVGAVVFRYKAMIEDRSNAAGILNLPFTVEAEAKGLKSLGGLVDLLGPYQAAGAFVMRSWATDNGPALERYLAAYVEAVRWIRDRDHQAEAVALLVDKLKLERTIAERTYDLLIVPTSGFTPDARFDVEGFRNMLALRAEIERKPDTEAAAPERYVDLGYYERAMKLVGR